MSVNNRTNRATATWERKAERGRRYDSTKVKRRNTKSAERRAYREYGQYDV